MKYLLMTIPDDFRELGEWLNGIVARGEARTLARELCVARGIALNPAEPPEEIATLVLAQGFQVLSDDQLRRVLGEPANIISLAETVFLNGSEFWNPRILVEQCNEVRVAIGRNALLREVAPIVSLAAMKPASRMRTAILASCATAAVLFIAFFTYSSFNNNGARRDNPQAIAQAKWGWQKADELNQIKDPAEYFTRIAELAEEWNGRDTSTPILLAQQITEFRAGCARLQLMQHQPLSEPQRQALLERCRKWAKKFDENLTTLESTGDSEKVRVEMNATVKQLTTILRAEAAKIRTA